MLLCGNKKDDILTWELLEHKISISTASLVPSPYGVENMFMLILILAIDLVYRRKKTNKKPCALQVAGLEKHSNPSINLCICDGTATSDCHGDRYSLSGNNLLQYIIGSFRWL